MTNAFLWLLVGHFVADYPLQGSFIGQFKNRHAARDYAGQGIAHAAIHAGTVASVTGSCWLGGAEFATHWVIDAAKCEGWTGINTDQALHVAYRPHGCCYERIDRHPRKHFPRCVRMPRPTAQLVWRVPQHNHGYVSHRRLKREP
jgi:hypothetical protein